MKALVGLMYKYGIPRNYIPQNLNLAPYIVIRGEESAAHRDSLTDVEIDKVRKAVGSVPYADYIYAMIYTGFRPSEFLALRFSDYDPKEQCVVAGAKTDAGKGRTVCLSPKIQGIFRSRSKLIKGGFLFGRADGSQLDLRTFTEECFYPALDAIGIENPMVTIAGGVERHRITPHSCRHTFSTLMKRVDAPSKDKLEMMGHTSEEMLRYYQDVNLDDLRRISEAI